MNDKIEGMEDNKNPEMEEFIALLDESFSDAQPLEDTLVEGKVIAIENDLAVIDVGLKTEGRVPLREFSTPGKPQEVSVGDKVEVYLERMENALGEAVISREKALREQNWVELEKSYNNKDKVDGMIFGRVKGGFTVDLAGTVAFLPGSQVDIRPTSDISPLMDISQPFVILKMDRKRGNIVVSRRAVLEETREEQRTELVQNLAEGSEIEGVVKNITDYGAFINLGGVDGLLHVTDIAWKRVNHPSEVLTIGDTIKVKIIKIDPKTHRVSLGIKQLNEDPWLSVESKYKVGDVHSGAVSNLTDYGAFVELEEGVEGLVHVTEMSWTKKNIHPNKILNVGDKVDIKVLELNVEKRRISLGMKQCIENPWVSFTDNYQVGSVIEGQIKNITDFGMFVGLDNDIDGMVHLTDLDWAKPGEEAIKEYSRGQTIKAVILNIEPEKERISLGVKQVSDDPFDRVRTLSRGSVITCEISDVQEAGIEVVIGAGLKSFIKRSELSRDRSEQRPERFTIGDKIDASIINIDKSNRKINLSIKAKEIAEEKEVVAQYGSSDSGASLGDILGAALNKASTDDGEAEKEETKAKAKPTTKGIKAETKEDKKSEAKAEADKAEADDTTKDASDA